jgi:hypothetical protein
MLPFIALIADALAGMAGGAAGAAGGTIPSVAAEAVPAIATSMAPGVTGFMDKLSTVGSRTLGDNFAGRFADASIKGELSPFKGLLTKENYQNPEGLYKAFAPFMSPEDRYSASLLTKAFPWKYANDPGSQEEAMKKLLKAQQ